MDALNGNYKRAKWANTLRNKALANLEAMAAQFNDQGKQAVAIARDDLLTHTDLDWWIEHCSELSTPAGMFCILSDTAQAAINALKQ